MRVFREVDTTERIEAAAQAVEWGYPREIPDDEASRSTWVSYGDDALLWYESAEFFKPNALALHGCSRPGARGRLGNPREMIAIEIIAELQGATRLYSLTGFPGGTSKIPRKAMRRYLRSRGWTNVEFGSYKDLGG
ncbi:MAG: hypothetical protein AAEJ52_06190 [Myxococcota bacterium]